MVLSHEIDDTYSLKQALAVANETIGKQRETITRLEQKVVVSGETVRYLERSIKEERAIRNDFVDERARLEAAVASKTKTISDLESLRAVMEADIETLQERHKSACEEKSRIASSFDHFAEEAKQVMAGLRTKVAELESISSCSAALEVELVDARKITAELERRFIDLSEKLSRSRMDLYSSQKDRFQKEIEMHNNMSAITEQLHSTESEKAILTKERDLLKQQLSNFNDRFHLNFERLTTLEEAAAKVQTERIKEKTLVGEITNKLNFTLSQLAEESRMRAIAEAKNKDLFAQSDTAPTADGA